MRLGRALPLSAAAGALVYVGFAAYTGFGRVAAELRSFAWSSAVAALLLALANYGLRFLKWQLFLRRLDLRVPSRDSLGIFLSGFALTITPGKVGELLKSYLLRSSYGLPIARTAPIVLAERVTDLLALLALALSGVGLLGGGRRLLIATALLVGLVLLAAASKRLVHPVLDQWARLPLVGSSAPKLRQAYQATAELLSPAPLAGATALSVLAWLCECIAFYLVLRGFPAANASLRLCTFIYAAMTVAGALSFLPGGLGVQEGGMIELLILMGRGIGTATAFAATFVTRLCTLWFAVALGVLALLLRRERVANLQELVE